MAGSALEPGRGNTCHATQAKCSESLVTLRTKCNERGLYRARWAFPSSFPRAPRPERLPPSSARLQNVSEDSRKTRKCALLLVYIRRSIRLHSHKKLLLGGCVPFDTGVAFLPHATRLPRCGAFAGLFRYLFATLAPVSLGRVPGFAGLACGYTLARNTHYLSP